METIAGFRELSIRRCRTRENRVLLPADNGIIASCARRNQVLWELS